MHGAHRALFMPAFPSNGYAKKRPFILHNQVARFLHLFLILFDSLIKGTTLTSWNGLLLMLSMKTTCYICTAYKTKKEYNKCTFDPSVENLVGNLDSEHFKSVKQSKCSHSTRVMLPFFPSVCPFAPIHIF